MKSFIFKLPDDLRARLEEESEDSGARLAEIVRRALERHLSERERGRKRREHDGIVVEASH